MLTQIGPSLHLSTGQSYLSPLLLKQARWAADDSPCHQAETHAMMFIVTMTLVLKTPTHFLKNQGQHLLSFPEFRKSERDHGDL